MARHVAGWRYPTEREMAGIVADAGRAGVQAKVEQVTLRQMGANVLRFECDCPRTIEIQTADAARLCGYDATAEAIVKRVWPEECHCDLIRLLKS